MRRNVDGSHGHPLGRTHIHFKPLSFCRCIFPGPSDRWISLRQQIWAGFAQCTCCSPSIRMELPCDHIRVAVWLCSLWHNMNQLERNLVQCCIGGNEALDVQIWQGRKPFAGHFSLLKRLWVCLEEGPATGLFGKRLWMLSQANDGRMNVPVFALRITLLCVSSFKLLCAVSYVASNAAELCTHQSCRSSLTALVL